MATRLSLLRMGVYLPKRTAALTQHSSKRGGVGMHVVLVCAHVRRQWCCRQLVHVATHSLRTQRSRTVKGAALERAVWLLHHHDVDGARHVRREAIDGTQDGGATQHHPALRSGAAAQ